MSRCRGGGVKSGDERDDMSLSRLLLPGGDDQLCRSPDFRFQLGMRDIEELLFERSVVVSEEPFAAGAINWARGSRIAPLKRHLPRASRYRKQLAHRFDAWHRITELTRNSDSHVSKYASSVESAVDQPT